jgi:type VI secretion system protein ImpG
VRNLQARPREVLVRGTPIRGTELLLTVDETHFDDEGELLLFSDVLSEFFSLYAPTNSFTELVVVREPSGEVRRCQPATGKQSLI